MRLKHWQKTPYDPIAGVYRWLADPFLGHIRKTVARQASRYKPPGKSRVLELAAGTGAQCGYFAALGGTVTGLDLSSGMLRQMTKRGLEKVQPVQADACCLPFRNNTFDIVSMQMALHEMGPRDRQAAMQEIKRVLSPEGVFIGVDFSGPRRGSLIGIGLKAIERAAGYTHYTNGQRFIADGGIVAFVERQGWTIKDRIPFYRKHIQLITAVRTSA